MKNLSLSRLSLTAMALTVPLFWAGCSHSGGKSAGSSTSTATSSAPAAVDTSATASTASPTSPGTAPNGLKTPGISGSVKPSGAPGAPGANTVTLTPGKPGMPQIAGKAPPAPQIVMMPKQSVSQVNGEIETTARKDGAQVKMPTGKGDNLTLTLKKHPSDTVASDLVTKYFAMLVARRRASGTPEPDATKCVVEVFDNTGKKVARADSNGYWPAHIDPPGTHKPSIMVRPSAPNPLPTSLLSPPVSFTQPMGSLGIPPAKH